MNRRLTAWLTEVEPDGEGARIVVLPEHTIESPDAWDLDIGWTLSPGGYSERQWLEGQALLAELIHADVPPRTILTAAAGWYQVAAATARHAFADRPAC